MNKPENYRRAWNGGKKPALNEQAQRFLSHVKQCPQCHGRAPFYCESAAQLHKEMEAAWKA